MKAKSILKVFALLTLLGGQLAGADAPVSATELRESHDAAVAIRSCYDRGAKDIHQMARCSGYLVNQEALAACRLNLPAEVCIPPKLCSRGLKEAPADRHCVIWSDWLDKPLTVEGQRLSRYSPISITQAVRGSTPIVPVPDALKACDKVKYEASREAHRPVEEARQELASCIVLDKVPLPPAIACLMSKHSKSYLEYAIDCGNKEVGGEVGRIAKCYTDANGDTTLTGLCGANVTLTEQQSKLYQCITMASNPNERILCAASPFLDQKTAKVANCVVENGGDFASSAACSADIQFPGTQGMNNEWRTTVQCAAASGGEPYTTSGCVATRLTLTELSKCVTGGVGKQDGCFGPNNSIVVMGKESVEAIGRVLKALDPQQMAGDLVHPGPNNEVRKVIDALTHIRT
jgi:hypothetical protein